MMLARLMMDLSRPLEQIKNKMSSSLRQFGAADHGSRHVGHRIHRQRHRIDLVADDHVPMQNIGTDPRLGKATRIR
jgi:hypothetical protein